MRRASTGIELVSSVAGAGDHQSLAVDPGWLVPLDQHACDPTGGLAVPAFRLAGRLSGRLLEASRKRASAGGPTPSSLFVPSATVIGRSVLALSVKHGTPSAVVSSCTPPESVRTAAAEAWSERNCRYPWGSSSWMRPAFQPTLLSIAFVRGWTGKSTGRRSDTCSAFP